MEFIKGYRRGYQQKTLSSSILELKSEDFKRGYIEARKDYREEEPPLF